MLLALFGLASTEISATAADAPPKASQASSLGEIPRDATALCVDNTWSSSKKRSGACSSHGGIKTWFGKPPKGSVARCNDGTYTKSAGQGACSSHGGVAYPLQEPKKQG
jgi:hypothetical protein